MNEPRAWHLATLLEDGRVLVAGDFECEPPEQGGECGGTDTAELYDPATDSFTPVGRMTASIGGMSVPGGGVQRPTAMTLPDGQVLVVGPWAEPQLDLFDPRSTTFTRVPSGCAGNAIMLPDGRVLVGCDRGPVFDPAIGRVVAMIDDDSLSKAGTTLTDGRIVLSDRMGGMPLLFDPDQEPDTPVWSNLETLLREKVDGALSIQTTTLLPDGRMLVFARRSGPDRPLERGLTTVFDPRLPTFTNVASPAGRFAPTATLLQDGRVLFVGKPDRSPDRTDPEPPAAELLDLGLPR